MSYHQVLFLFFMCQSFYCLLIGYCTNKYNNKLITERGSMGYLRCALCQPLCEVIFMYVNVTPVQSKPLTLSTILKVKKIISTFYLFGNFLILRKWRTQTFHIMELFIRHLWIDNILILSHGLISIVQGGIIGM